MWDKVAENERSLRFAALLGINGTPRYSATLVPLRAVAV